MCRAGAVRSCSEGTAANQNANASLNLTPPLSATHVPRDRGRARFVPIYIQTCSWREQLCTACFYSPAYIKGFFANGLRVCRICIEPLRVMRPCTHTIYICIYIYICSWVCVKLSPEMGQILEVFYVCHDSWAPILKMFSQYVLWMQVRVVVSESSQPLSSCHALKRADYICTLWLRVIWRSSSESNHTYFTHITNILDQTY